MVFIASRTARPVALAARRGIAHSSVQGQPWVANSLKANSLRPATTHDNGERKVLRMLMFGKPGAGKGTLSARLVQKYDILSLSTGDLLRQHIAEKTEVGREAEEIVAQGGLLPDDMVLRVVTTNLDKLQNKHWILDGFPRTLRQGELLDSHLRSQNMPLSLVVNIDVPDSIILSRISDRWVHLASGRVYNLSYNRPKVAGLDDKTGEPLTQRPDDNPATFSRRLAKFYESTSPLLSYFDLAADLAPTGDPKLLTLTGSTSDEIWPKLDAHVRTAFPGLRERVEARGMRFRAPNPADIVHEQIGLAKENGKAMMEAWTATARWSA